MEHAQMLPFTKYVNFLNSGIENRQPCFSNEGHESHSDLQQRYHFIAFYEANIPSEYMYAASLAYTRKTLIYFSDHVQFVTSTVYQLFIASETYK